MEEFVKAMADAINSSLGAPLTVMLLAMIPITESRFAILFATGVGLSPGEAFGYAFLGSSLMAPILLLALIPIINALSKTKFFSKIGKFLYSKFEKKSRSITTLDESADKDATGNKKKFKISKKDLKKMAGTAAFVAVPIPLTGVWTGSAVASISKVGFVKGLIGIIVGNAAACGIMTLIGYLFKDYIWYITLGFLAIAVIIVIVLIVKFILYKPPKDDEAALAAADASVSGPAENSAGGSDTTASGIAAEHNDTAADDNDAIKE